MPRLIDADDLLMDNSWAFYDENGNRNDACIAVENAPTVEAEPVVRCKDCRYFNKYGFKLEYTECTHFDCDVAEDGFCAWGERKEYE